MPKTFILTGSSRGLGRSIALAVLEAGHQLVATARDPRRLQDLVEQYGGRVLPVALDVTDYAAAQRAVADGVARFGRLDVVVNNAGFANVGAVEDMPPAAIEAQFATNFMGSVHLIKAALPALRAQGSGHVIQISSIGARIATPGAAAYYATKWALSGFVASLALEVAPLGIHVTAVEPGGMKTDFAKDSSVTMFPSSPPYAGTAGAVIAMMSADGYADDYADPARVAALVLSISELENPPVRLLAGSAVLSQGVDAGRAQAESDREWGWLSRKAD
ncbi:SDR family NAD(P)-dependent oxidoreductase [Ramlibacter sp. AN1133]|uniref:SDR family NAD(P)-dependent oxidoreductase n=1 Tax=Ramlibacter sp. AN1133 TaxID=3133429 RepID=UPI0030C2091D